MIKVNPRYDSANEYVHHLPDQILVVLGDADHGNGPKLFEEGLPLVRIRCVLVWILDHYRVVLRFKAGASVERLKIGLVGVGVAWR